MAVCRSDLLLRLCIQAGKCAALPAGGCGAEYLLREERHHSLGDRASHKPDGIAHAGSLVAGQTARGGRGDEGIYQRIRTIKFHEPKLLLHCSSHSCPAISQEIRNIPLDIISSLTLAKKQNHPKPRYIGVLRVVFEFDLCTMFNVFSHF